MNKNKIIIFLCLLLLTSSTYFAYQYQLVKNDNLSLKLKLNMASKSKKEAISWSKLKEESSKETKSANSMKTTTSVVGSENEERVDIRDLATDGLIKSLQASLRQHWKLNAKELNRGLEIVNELIARNPNVYSSYKGKLILLLTRENIQNKTVDDDLVEEVLTTMSEFDVVSSRTLQKEAILIAKSNTKADDLISGIEKLDIEIEDTTDELLINEKELQLAKRMEELDALENQLENGLLDDADFLNEDIIDIPLLRSLAKKDYDLVIEESESLLSEFPNSVAGHFFLIRALKLSGNHEQALDYIENLEMDESKIDALNFRLKKSEMNNPSNYWKGLRF